MNGSDKKDKRIKTSRQGSTVSVCKIVSHFVARNEVVDYGKRKELKILTRIANILSFQLKMIR